ncbi:hypothetical protein JCM3770_000016 [Rhodotorula araucariae]
MQLSRFLPILPFVFSSVAAQLISIPGLDIGLLRNGALLDLNLVGNLLGGGSCPDATVGVRTSLLGLIRVCACVNVLRLGSTDTACPPCTANASPVCGGSGTCACSCNSGFFATQSGACVPNTNCRAPNTLTQVDTYSVCTCAAGYVSDGAGGCVLTPSSRARTRHRRGLGGMRHHTGQDVFAPQSSERLVRQTCPDGETACPLPSGDYECVDTTSLSSCGGCVGNGGSGRNCLAIPGALSVQCLDSKCHVGSCFKGWRHLRDGNGRCA